MESIYGPNGTTIAWLLEQNVYDLLGNVLAFVRNENVYNYSNGRYLGRLNNGYFRDKMGNAVAFMAGAGGGPLYTIQKWPPLPPLPRINSWPAIAQIPPIPAINTFNWSNVGWERFLEG